MLSIETCIWFRFQFEIQLIQDYFPPALELNKLKTLVECLEGKQGVKSPPPPPPAIGAARHTKVCEGSREYHLVRLTFAL